MNNPSPQSVREISIRRLNGASASEDQDLLATEEPMEIRVEGHSVAVVMRTPGENRELTAEFLVTEGLVKDFHDLVEIKHQLHCVALGSRGADISDSFPELETLEKINGHEVEPSFTIGNVVNLRLRNPNAIDLKQLTRHVFTSSSCGICSRASINPAATKLP